MRGRDWGVLQGVPLRVELGMKDVEKQSVVSASRREVKVLQEHTHMPSAPFPMPWALLRLPPPSALRR